MITKGSYEHMTYKKNLYFISTFILNFNATGIYSQQAMMMIFYILLVLFFPHKNIKTQKREFFQNKTKVRLYSNRRKFVLSSKLIVCHFSSVRVGILGYARAGV